MPARNPDEPSQVVVLAVTAFDEDEACLKEIFSHSNWIFKRVHSCHAARDFLHNTPASVVICERALPDGGWRDLLEAASELDDPPHLIVASSSADDRLWSEVLNLGGYDLLEKPFDRQEVFRISSLAWRHWKDEIVRKEQSALASTG